MLEATSSQLRPGRGHQGLPDTVGEGRRVRRFDQDARCRDDIRNGPRRAGHNRHASGHRLDGHPAELLAPAGPRERRHRHDVERVVPRHQLRPACVPQEFDSALDSELNRELFEYRALRTVARDLQHPPGVRRDSAKQYVDALVRFEPTHVADHCIGPGCGTVGRREQCQVDAERYVDRGPGKALSPQYLTGLDVADVGRPRSAQGLPLDPPKRDRVSLLEVLRRIQHIRRTNPSQPSQQQHLGRDQGIRLFVQVDEVGSPAEFPPDGNGIHKEDARVGPDRACARHKRVLLGVEAHHDSALVPRLRRDQRDVHPARDEFALALAPR